MGLLSGPKNSRVTLKVRDADGTVREVALTRNSTNKDGTPFLWRWMRWMMFDPLIETKTMAPDIQYVRISNFGNERVVEEFLNWLDGLDLQRIQGMILDVRFNSGGNSDYAYVIAGALTDEPLKASKWKSLSYVPAHRSWGRPTDWIEGGPTIIEPRRGKRYSGPLVVLTGPATFSAAEDFLVPLQYSGRAVLVGEKTAGSTGNPIVVRLARRRDIQGGLEKGHVSRRPGVRRHRHLARCGSASGTAGLLRGADPCFRKAWRSSRIGLSIEKSSKGSRLMIASSARDFRSLRRI